MGEQSGAGGPGRPVSGRQLPPHLDPRRSSSRRSDAPAPERDGARRRPAVLRALAWLAVLSSVAVVATAGVGWALVHNFDNGVTRLGGVFNKNDSARPAAAPRDAKNILLVGSDSRGNLKPGEGTQGTGDSFVTGQRSDTVILAHLFADSDQAELISFPRDSYVTIPARTDQKTGELRPAHQDKLNAALADGGPQLLIRTIETLTGDRIRVDNYLQIDFEGFKSLVDTLGGVEVCLSKPAKEKDSGIDLPAGRQTIEGSQALAFVRQRKELPGGDLGRIRRQQQFIGAIVRKVTSAGTLLNPVKLGNVVDAASQSVQIDDTLSNRDLLQLAMRFRNVSAGGVSFVTVPVADAGARRKTPIGRSEVVLLDEPKLAALFERLQRDIPPGAPAPAASATPGPPLIVPAAKVQVRVLNGAGVAGLGSRAASDLKAAGFQVVGAPGNRGTQARMTAVRYGPDKVDSARTLAAALPGSVLQADPKLSGTLELVLGSDYQTAQPVTVGGSASAAAPATPAKSGAAASPPAVKTAAEDPCAP